MPVAGPVLEGLTASVEGGAVAAEALAAKTTIEAAPSLFNLNRQLAAQEAYSAFTGTEELSQGHSMARNKSLHPAN